MLDCSHEDVARAVLEKSAVGIAVCVAEWMRVGFCQGNFNADNCLVAGRTMDYGPFGFLYRLRSRLQMDRER